MTKDLFLGLDLSTQQLKGILVDADLNPVCHEKVEFDVDFPEYKTKKGVYVNNEKKEVQAPVVMWLDAVDLLFSRFKARGQDLSTLKAISGACQQHGSVFWNDKARQALNGLEAGKGDLKSQLEASLAWQLSPNWQDHSTATQCDEFEAEVGGKDALAKLTGSKAHHRFTGPQILKLKEEQPEVYAATDRIALVSSFLASVFAGNYAPIDISDACGMNLWDIEKKQWNPKLLGLFGKSEEIAAKLGDVEFDGKKSVGKISDYFVTKYGVASECQIVVFTGDNPGTILSLPLQANDIIVSLGTSTTALVVTENYVPSPLYHLFSHPTAKTGYMGMLCYCNGALAREQVRDAINAKHGLTHEWTKFDEVASTSAPNTDKIGFYFPLSEIIPDVPATVKRFIDNGSSVTALESNSEKWTVEDDARCILESQALSIRHRLAPMLTTEGHHPRKIYFVGGGSKNQAICEIMTSVLVPEEGAYTLDLTDACAIGAATKAVYGIHGGSQKWDDFISSKFNFSRTATITSTQPEDKYADLVRLFVKSEEHL
ncbi:xylulose kinase [Trichomonascus vanleenenianus]|uniref:xylulokinase n=1 Tax=Trichomonascus vanleenenianus TaxID=2268995 RepID=UPI003ECB2F50